MHVVVVAGGRVPKQNKTHQALGTRLARIPLVPGAAFKDEEDVTSTRDRSVAPSIATSPFEQDNSKREKGGFHRRGQSKA